MSFFDDASLVMIPSGYKTSKVYSVKPTDGTGDLAFSRSNDTATRVASNGLIEKVRTNVVLQSNTFNTTWASAGGGTTTATIGATDPNGGATAWTLAKTGAAGRIEQFPTLSGQVTLSIYAKTGTLNWIAFTNDVGSVYCNLNTGAISLSSAGGSAVSVGNGWYRITMTTASNGNCFRIYPANGDGDVSGTTGNVLIWSAQKESGDIATPYIATTTAAVSVGPVANVPRLDYLNSSCPRLLLEPQRSSLVTFSEQMDNAAWTKAFSSATANAVTSPSGYQDADKIVEDSSNSEHYLQRSFTTTASTNYSLSGFFKAGERSQVALQLISLSAPFENVIVKVNLTTGTITEQVAANGGTLVGATITALSNGWYRVTVTGNIGTKTNMSFRIYTLNNSGALTYTGDGTSGAYFWGAQFEEGAYATSYIPTLGAAVTRGADACSKTGISSLIGQTEGTIYFEVDVLNGAGIQVGNSTSANDYVNSIQIAISPSATNAGAHAGGVSQFNSASAGRTGMQKIAVAYGLNNYALYINGTQIATDSSATVPAMSAIIFNHVDLGTTNGKVAQTLLFKTRLTNAQLAELTA